MAQGEKQSVALASLIASALLTLLKLAAWFATGSLGILSEAIHSALDFGATVITWFAVRWSDEPPDDVHHYGHGKIESVAALIETGLLFLTTGWIIYEAVHRLVSGDTQVTFAWWAGLVVVISIAVDFQRARALRRVAERTHSEALEADALHFSSDMWSSLVVLFGLAASWAGFSWADPLAALAVSGFVALAAWRLGRRTVASLLDAAPEGATETIRGLIQVEHGVLAVRRLRLRPAGGTMFVGAVVDVARTVGVDSLIALKARLETVIRDRFPQADATVTLNPVPLDDESITQRVMLIAGRQQQAIHHLTIQRVDGRLAVSFDLEVDAAMPLGEAHEVATRLEEEVRNELGLDVEVESHIEPLPETNLGGTPAAQGEARGLVRKLEMLAAKATGLSDLHNIRVRNAASGVIVHYHCRFAPGASIERVHAVLDRIERDLRDAHPDVRRVVAHAEPVGRAPHKV